MQLGAHSDPGQLVIIQPTPFCNINCRYCYLPGRLSKERISFHTLARISRVLFTAMLPGENLSIVWHAGEPLVMAIRFYEEAFSIIDRFNTQEANINHSFQTNGTLIDQAWCDFIIKRSIRIGVSLDGPKHIHDSSRVYRTGKGTFDDTMRGIELLQKNNIDFHIISVLTKEALDCPEEIWNFFLQHRIRSLAFNAEEVEGVNRHSSLQGTEVLDKYAHFFRRLLQLRDDCQETVFVRELDSAIEHIKYATGPVRSIENSPLSILSFDCAGNISTFSPELLTMTHPAYRDFVFGNVSNNEIGDILKDPKFMEINSEIQKGVARCNDTCEYFTVCGGGPPSNKLCENGSFDSAETMNCSLTIKAITDVVLEYFEHKYQVA